MKTVHLSPSKVAAYENCPRAYYYQYVLRIKNSEDSVHLGFGISIGKAFESYVVSMVDGSSVDPVAVFEDQWTRYITSSTVVYPAKFTAEDMVAIGKSLMTMLPSAWEESGLMPVLDQDGKPIVERALSVNLGSGVILNTQLDLLAMNMAGEIGVVDVKSPQTASSLTFTLNAEQLTAYQATVNAHAEQLGIDKVQFVSYWEFLKKKVPGPRSKKDYEGPKICRPHPVAARNDEDVSEYVGKLHAIADNIRAGRFYKSPRMAFNTPCTGCQWARLCIEKDSTGYILPANVKPEDLSVLRPTG